MEHRTEAIIKAKESYARNARDWKFLGYSEALATTILIEFFLLGRVRNPSPKPLNVLAMVGKQRVRHWREFIEREQRLEAELEESEREMLESEDESEEGDPDGTPPVHP